LTTEAKPLRIAINAQLLPGGGSGGIEQFVAGLVHGLGRLQDGNEEYVIVGHWLDPQALAPLVGSNQRIVSGPHGSRLQAAKHLARRALGPVYGLARRAAHAARPAPEARAVNRARQIPESGGLFEALDVDVVHFPYQTFTRCAVPTIYNPHDLQHLHYPEFFTHDEINRRETLYSQACRTAQAVVADARCVRDDIISHYGVEPARTYAIIPGPPSELYETVSDEILARVRRKFRLPETFALYPAQTWPHKNHIRLLEALKLLRDQSGLSPPLVCTGTRNEFWPTIRNRMRDLRLGDRVRFLGFVAPVELRALYRLAQFVVFPSLFEGAGLPILEAFAEGAPVACSAVTSLAEYGGDAVLPLDPTSVESIAEALRRMTLESNLRAALRARGAARARLFSWEKAARAYRALYRKMGGVTLTEEDARLLSEASASEA